MPRYCIVDIETTNGRLQGNKVTEVALFLWEDGQCIDQFESLVNPGVPIPAFIEGLTGISDAMVKDAPPLQEIAPRILDFLEGAIFVAHSVQFDYNVLKGELESLGYPFVFPRLCTVRLSRSLVPGLRSYSLGKLCSSLGIPLSNRHRAAGDARATVLLFEYLLSLKGGEETIKRFLNRRSREASLPPGIKAAQIQALPDQPGVYYFRNGQGEMIYIGKAINIRKRVWSHFYGKSTKAQNIRKEIASVDFELSGSELLALLMESAAIQRHFPKFNRAQKRKTATHAIFSYEDRQGMKHLGFDQFSRVPDPLLRMPSARHCQELLQELCVQTESCPKYFQLLAGAKSCRAHPLRRCLGECTALKNREMHNRMIESSLELFRQRKQDQFITLPGRKEEEMAFLFLEGGQYSGYGFAPTDRSYQHLEDLEPFLIRCKNTPETQGILSAYLLKNGLEINSVGKPLIING